MGIVAARVVPYRLALRRPWVAAAATLTERRGALLQVTTEEGFTGWGDCAPLPSAAGAAQVLAALHALVSRLPGMEGPIADAPSEVAWALETALADAAAQGQGVSLARFLGAGEGAAVAVNAALGPLDDGCPRRARDAVAAGYAIGKIKVGIDAPARELARLRALARETEGRLALRLDANRAWPDDAAARFLAALADLPIDGVEEPLVAPTVAGLAALQADVPFVIAVDESLPILGVTALVDAGAVRRFVVKPARLGGIAATRALAAAAAAAGIEVVLTSVVDSAVGVIAAAHLAAAVSPAIAHGLATGAWLAEDVAPPLPIMAGRMVLPDAPGLGLAPEGAAAPWP